MTYDQFQNHSMPAWPAGVAELMTIANPRNQSTITGKVQGSKSPLSPFGKVARLPSNLQCARFGGFYDMYKPHSNCYELPLWQRGTWARPPPIMMCSRIITRRTRSSLLPTLAFYYMVQIGIVHTAKNIISQKKTNRKIGLTCGWMKNCLILMGKRQNWPYIRHSLASEIKCININLWRTVN